MAKLSKDGLAAFQSKLESIDSNYQSNFNLRETVAESFNLIQKARKYKVSWEEIAGLLKESSGTNLAVSPESIRQYYFEFSKNPELLPKRKRKSKGSKSEHRNISILNTASDVVSTITIETPKASVAVEDSSLKDSPVPIVNYEQDPDRNNPVQEFETEQSKQEPFYKSKEDVKAQFNLGRRRN